MKTLTIRSGLRRLEFQPQESAEPGSRAAHVIVEFATPTALTPGQTVQINLGIREGIERMLAGSPQLVKSRGEAKDPFLYRLEGDVG